MTSAGGDHSSDTFVGDVALAASCCGAPGGVSVPTGTTTLLGADRTLQYTLLQHSTLKLYPTPFTNELTFTTRVGARAVYGSAEALGYPVTMHCTMPGLHAPKS